MHMRRHDPARYVDARAFEEYEDHDGQEVVVSECVVGSPSAVFDAWLQEIWLAGGTELHEGVGRGYVGHVRRAALGVEEEILSAGLPVDSEEEAEAERLSAGRPSRARQDSSKIPTICYKVHNFGPLPMQNHLALVRFVDVAASAESTPATLVIWTFKTEPTALGYLFCCGGLARLILRTALQSFLRSLAASAEVKANRHLE